MIRPEILFLFGAAQALLPYVLWAFGGGVRKDNLGLTYTPITIWILAYVSFFIGTRLTSLREPKTRYSVPRSSAKKVIANVGWIIVAAIFIQLLWARKVYGTFPLLSYIRGDGQIDAATANYLQQNSAFGQFGLLNVSALLGNGVLLSLLMLNIQTRRRRTLLVASLFFTISVANLMNGKRQGLFITIVYICIGFILSYGSPACILSLYLPVLRGRLWSFVAVLVAASLGVSLMGYLSSARNQGQRGQSGGDEIISYLEYPLLNFDSQCDQSGGLGPYSFMPLYPFRSLLPYKMTGLGTTAQIGPIKIEDTSPSGMFESIQWGWGPIGVVLFCFSLGIVCNYVYQRAFENLTCLLMYPLLGYALFTAHSYNHFFNLVFVPVPALVLWLFARAIKGRPIYRAVGAMECEIGARQMAGFTGQQSVLL